MSKIYQTPDGKKFTSLEQAQAHWEKVLQAQAMQTMLDQYRSVIGASKLDEGLKAQLLDSEFLV